MSDNWNMSKVKSFRWMIRAKRDGAFMWAAIFTVFSMGLRETFGVNTSFDAILQLLCAAAVGFNLVRWIYWICVIYLPNGLRFYKKYEEYL